MSPVSTKSRVPQADMRKVRDDARVSCYSIKRKRFYYKVPEELRFWAKVKKTRTCWLWLAGRVGPYGSFDGRPAHAWIAKNVMKVNVSHKMVIDHACCNQLCVRPHPKHLRFVPQRVNLTNGPNHVGQKILQTHCEKGHPFSGRNLLLRNRNGKVHRRCRICQNEYSRNYAKQRRNECPRICPT